MAFPVSITDRTHRRTWLILIFLKCLLFLSGIGIARAQNIQLHYDMGRNRGYLTSTIEEFVPDKHGSTFFFTDVDYNSVPEIQGVTMAYLEIARAFRFREFPLAFHTEYNGGMGALSAGNAIHVYPIESAFLNGLEYSLDAGDLSRGFTLQLLHKFIRGKHTFSFQITGVWYIHFFGGKLSFTGFADFWREDLFFEGGTTKFCFSAEPQLWYHLTPRFALGGETEADVNFGGQKGFHCYPTVGIRYSLER